MKCITISLSTSTWSHCFVGVEGNSGSVCFFSDEGPTLETLDFAFCIGSTPTFFHFHLYLNTAYAAHYVYFMRRERLIEMQIKRIFINWWPL